MEGEIFNNLIKFIIEQRWEYEFPLTKDKLLYEDLGIYGDDATDFFIAFSTKFNVDISNFEIGNYFKGEGDRTLEFIFRLLKKKSINEKHLSLTIGDLERAILAGKLDDTVIEK